MGKKSDTFQGDEIRLSCSWHEHDRYQCYKTVSALENW